MRIGIFPGSFNPIHIGHLSIANYIAEFEGYDEVWFLITPQNPTKNKSELLPEQLRFDLLEKSIKGYKKFKSCTIEWTLPKPTYTITTLQKLRILHPEHNFELIIGSDNWEIFHRWKDYQRILNNFKVCIYPRRGSHKIYPSHPNTKMIKAPIVEVSSSFIRKCMTSGKDVRFFMPSGIYETLLKEKAFESENISKEIENKDEKD